mgnify:CR=1 FL=1
MHVLDARFLAAAPRQSALPPPAFAEVAFAGRSNVGKSSLINALLERRRLVRTSSTPGCTRGLSLFRARLRPADGSEATLDLVDLPGYGFARRSKAERRSWGPMVEGFLNERVGLRAVVVIVDVRRGPEDDDRQLLEYLAHLGLEVIVVATKLDKLSASKRKPALRRLAPALGQRPVGFSATSGEGRDVLWRRIARAASLGPAAPPASAHSDA